MDDKWIGIDYGSKLAGTTVISYLDTKGLVFIQSEKKKDADLLISNFISDYRPTHVFIDAPLSLPAAYYGKGDDFFYRQCDRELKAMSPMFLGGLTARAMKLKSAHPSLNFLESYPGYYIRVLSAMGEDYQKKKAYSPDIHNKLKRQYKLKFKVSPSNWHQLDALACWIIGLRYFNKQGNVIGDPNEGLIHC